MANILIVEDDENLGLSLKSCIEGEGHNVELATHLKSAREMALLNPDLLILDWMLPDGQGLDFVRELRRQGNNIPVILLTARADLVDKVLGLEMGANDYMTKPFEPRELLARIRVQLRVIPAGAIQIESESMTMLRVGSLTMDRVKHRVFFRETEIQLVKKEYDLLFLFAENPEKVFSRDEILNKVWGYEVYPTTRTVDTHIMFLRQKIHSDLIETVRAVGYRLKPL